MSAKEYLLNVNKLLDNVPAGIAIYRLSNSLETLYHNDGICVLSGHTPREYEEIIKGDALRIVLPDDQKELMDEVMSAAVEKRNIDFTYRIQHKTKGFAWVHLVASHVETEADGVPIYYAIFTDISDERNIQKKLTDIAEHDHLTGALNRIRFERIVEESLFDKDEKTSAFIMVDIDEFKIINDYLGHTKGDEVLCTIANSLDEIFGRDNTVARIGGDEFAIFVADIGSDKALLEKVEKFQIATRNEYMYEDTIINSSCSLGIAFTQKDGDTYNKLYVNADKALLHAKHKGKNQYQVFDDFMSSPSPLLLKNMAWLLDMGTSAIYVCNAETYELLYMNKLGKQMAGTKGNEFLGNKCYEELMHRSSPCEFCKMDCMRMDTFFERPFVAPLSKKRLRMKGKLIVWDGIKAHVEFITADERYKD